MYLKMTPLLRIKYHFFGIFTVEITCVLILLSSSLSYCRNTLPVKSCSTVDVTRSHRPCCCITSGTESEGAEERFCVYVGDRVAATSSEQGLV